MEPPGDPEIQACTPGRPTEQGDHSALPAGKTNVPFRLPCWREASMQDVL